MKGLLNLPGIEMERLNPFYLQDLDIIISKH